MDPAKKNRLGRVDLEVTAFGFGTAPIGNIFRPISDGEARAMIDTAWDAGVRFFDTAAMYGHGLSELRLGEALRWRNRDDFVVASKVGRVLKPARRKDIDFGVWNNPASFRAVFDYSYDGTMRAFEDALQRMALEHMEICFIHDIDVYTHGVHQPEMFRAAMDGAAKALLKLREEGAVKAVGVGVNEWEVCHAALQAHDFDCFLLAGRYTLLEQEAIDAFLPLCATRGAAVVVGGGFNSGILATGAVEGAKYNYSAAPPAIMEKVRKIEAVCRAHGVPLPAAALQFVVAHPQVPSFIAGTRTVEQLKENLDWFSRPIPADLWAELKHVGLLRADAPVPA